MSRPRPAALLVLVWMLGAVLATATGLLALHLVANQVGDQSAPPLSAGEVKAALTPRASPSPSVAFRAATPAAAAKPTASAQQPRPPQPTRPAPTAPPATPATHVAVPVRTSAPATFTAPGGTVGAQCRGTTPRLLYATPSPGYTVKDSSVHDEVLKVHFEADDSRSGLEIGCQAGQPVLLKRTD